MSTYLDSPNQASQTPSQEPDYKPVALSITRHRRLEPFLEVLGKSVRTQLILELYLVA